MLDLTQHPDTRAQLSEVGRGLNDLWFLMHQCMAVAQAAGQASEAPALDPLLSTDQLDTLQGLAAAIETIARQARERAGELQTRLATCVKV